MNPFSDPEFRDEFRQEVRDALEPVNRMLAKHEEKLDEHAQSLTKIKTIGGLLSFIATCVVGIGEWVRGR